MRILVLGGTVFLGRAIVETALARGHQVTVFNRGDRDGDLTVLRGRSFDAVIDTSGYTPAHVSAVTETLGGDFEHYTFISSISVPRGVGGR